MVIEIKHRFSSRVIFSTDAETLRLVVEIAVTSEANLSWANLSGANLSGANLSGANLSGANLSGANLSEANLSGANLRLANLSGANLSGANLRLANLSGANLSGANVFAVSASEATSNYDIFMTQTHIKIGCQFHKIADWFSFDDKKILSMDSLRALYFWRKWKDVLISVASINGWYQK